LVGTIICAVRFLCAPFLISRASRNEFILEFPHKTLNRPRAGFPEGANRPATGNVVRYSN
jgi:hypothetical protein